MKTILLTTALMISISVPAFGADLSPRFADLPPRLPLGSAVLPVYPLPTPETKPAFAFETVGVKPIVPSADYNVLRDAFDCVYTTDEQRLYMKAVAVKRSVNGVTDWTAVRSEYFPAVVYALANFLPIGVVPAKPHLTVGKILGGIVMLAVGVGAAAYVDSVENTYHTSSSYTDASGRRTTVKCDTYVGSNRVDSSCR